MDRQSWPCEAAVDVWLHPSSTPVAAPGLELIDAVADDLDDRSLRDRARSFPAAQGAPHTSRSYSFPYALVGWHGDRIGVDIERVVPCNERFGRSICTPQEATLTPWVTDEEIISLWSAKEALAKALGDPVRYDPRRLQSPAGWHDGVCGPWRARRIAAPRGYCAWICWQVLD